jgi:hypothetical protein
MARSRIKGVAKVKRIMRALPDAMRDQIADALEQSGKDLAAEMSGRTPSRTGALRAGIKWRVLRKTMRLRVGLIDAPKVRNKLFYGRILDLGRKAQTVTVNRRIAGVAQPGGGKAVAGARVAKYTMRVRAIAPKRFVTGRYPDLRAKINDRLRGVWTRALSKIAGGNDG